MASTLVRHRPRTASASSPRTDRDSRTSERARDWAEIQERMLVPLYEAVYERLEVGPHSRLLGLGCGSGLALLIAAARGASVTGADPDTARLELARERLAAAGATDARFHADGPGGTGGETVPGLPYTLVTLFQPLGGEEEAAGLDAALREAASRAERGAAVVLTGWGPPERCATSGVLRVADKATGRAPSPRDELEEVAARAGLRPDGSGRVACPFGYADTDSAVRGLMSTGLYDAAVRESERAQVEKEITEALHPYVRPDGTVWMPNVFRYLIARTP